MTPHEGEDPNREGPGEDPGPGEPLARDTVADDEAAVERRVVICAREEERRRIARDLHDLIGQRLTALRLKVELLRWSDTSELAQRVEDVLDLTDRIDHELDFFAWELRAAAIDDLGLVSALGTLVREWSRTYRISASFQSDGLGSRRLTHDIENALYRISQEALNNVFKHARAHHVSVVLEARGGEVILTLKDDGCGFDPNAGAHTNARNGRMGLNGMRERALLVGGSFDIESAPGRGTAVVSRVPVVLADDVRGERRRGVRERRDLTRGRSDVQPHTSKGLS